MSAARKTAKLAKSDAYRQEAKRKGLCPVCLKAPRCKRNQHCEECTQRGNEKRLVRVANFKRLIFDHYGRKCACTGCEITHEEFLTIDHVGGWGRHHRGGTGKRIGGEHLYRQIIKFGFPDTFRILCFNCNCSQAFRGFCPHEKLTT